MKCGEVTIDANGVEHRREWETDETPSEFMERMNEFFTARNPMGGPNTFRVSAKVHDMLRKAIG